MKHGWFIRGKHSKLFVGMSGPVLRAFALPADATLFNTEAEARAALAATVMARDLEVVDMAIHDPLPPDADQTPVRTAAQVRQDALDEDRPREAERRATWGLIQKAAAVAIGALLFAGALFTGPAAAHPRDPFASTWSYQQHGLNLHHTTRSAHVGHPRHYVSRRTLTRHARLRLRSHSPAGLVVAHDPINATADYIRGQSVAAVVVAQKYLGTNPTGHASLWCADFANFVERQLGRPGTGSREAVSFLHYGTRVHNPAPGDIVVLGRTGGGHVGFLIKQTADGPLIISGNHNHRVGIGVYDPRRVLAYVRPS